MLVRAKHPGAVYVGGRKFSHDKGQRLTDKQLEKLVATTEGKVKVGRLLFLTGRLELFDDKGELVSVEAFKARFPDAEPSRLEAALETASAPAEGDNEDDEGEPQG